VRRGIERAIRVSLDEISHIETAEQAAAKATIVAERHINRFGIALDNMTQGLLLFDESERLVVCNQRYLEIYGLSSSVVKPGCSFRELMGHRKQTGSFEGDVGEYCSSVLRDMARYEVSKVVIETGDGRAIRIVSQMLAVGGWVATHEDITERQRFDDRIAHLAHFDALTDLPNRVLFGEQLDRALKTVPCGQQLAVLYIDIDEFKGVNDSLGHMVGDELLKAVAGRLRSCLTATEFAYRLGGMNLPSFNPGSRDWGLRQTLSPESTRRFEHHMSAWVIYSSRTPVLEWP
jgi:hypothetical protein